MKLLERITGAEHYVKRFSEWEATEQIIDNTKAFWMLKKPDSEYQKVCLYRDGCNMFVYGDYGQFTFDKMTWQGSAYNLEYDNIGYQMEKLSHESRKFLSVYDDYECRKDILDWFKEKAENLYPDIRETDEEFNTLIEKCQHALDNGFYFYPDDFCEENNCKDLESILDFTYDLLQNTDEYEWISYLRRSTDKLQEFDEVYESSLWSAGKTISQSYFICMYALQVCGEKLETEKNKENL